MLEVRTLQLLKPDEIIDSVYDIELQRLKEKGIKGLIVDLDNTLVPWQSREVTKELESWVKKVCAAGLQIAIVSNNSSSRVEELSGKLGITCVAKAVKPRRGAFRRIAGKFQMPPHEIAVVGDQLFTDILGGNRCGMYTILVAPLSKKEFIGTKIMRLAERLFIRRS